MSFRTITRELAAGFQNASHYEIYFSPPPSDEEVPTVWLDLHVADDGYFDCGYERGRKFKSSSDGRLYVRIRPKRAIRVATQEVIGLDCNHVAVITNAASKAKHGLIVATGKMDPGFSRNRLVIVVYNQADRAVDLYAGDKVACIAFSKISDEAKATKSVGHGSPVFPYYAPTVRERARKWYETQIQPQWGVFLLKVAGRFIGYMLAALVGAYLAVKGVFS